MTDAGIHSRDPGTTSPLAAPLPQPRLAPEEHRIAAQRRAEHDVLVRSRQADPGPSAGAAVGSGARSRVLLAAAALTEDPEERTRLQAEVAVLHLGLARAVASRYRGRGTTDEELDRAASDGLLEAVRTFDGSSDEPFLSHAVTAIKTHVKRHLGLDDPVVHRLAPLPVGGDAVQRLTADIARARAALGLDLGRSPRVAEVARHLGVREESVVEAVAADEQQPRPAS